MNPVDFIHDKTNLAKHITSALGYAQPMILPFGNLIVYRRSMQTIFLIQQLRVDIMRVFLILGIIFSSVRCRLT